MKFCAIVFAASVAVFVGGCDSGSRHHRNGPTEEQLQARESGAAEGLQGFLYSYLDGDSGLPNEKYFIPGFNLDGYDRSKYLARFWDADAAEELDGGVIRMLYGDSADGAFYDLQVTSSVSPLNLALPVVVELSVIGETMVADTTASYYSALWYFFMLENPDQTFSVTAQAPTWEYEVLAESPETFNFIVNEVMVNGSTVYKTTGQNNDPSFYVTKLQTTHGATFLIDVALLAVGQESAAFLETNVTGRLFYKGSPAESENNGLGNIAFTQNLQPFWNEAPMVSGVLAVPAGLAPGQYTFYVRVENESVDPTAPGVFAYDIVTVPIEVR